MRNKYSGLLRFFFYTYSASASNGTTQSFWGIRVDGASTNLFDFTRTFAQGANKKQDSPAYIVSPEGSLTNGVFEGNVGYKFNTWYGLELECSYDPSLASTYPGNPKYFNIGAWAMDKIELKGEMVTNGSINGTIKTSLNNSSGFNLSLSNMFNKSDNSKTSISLTNNYNSLITIADTIDSGIKKGDPFFKGLWNNIKGNAGKWISSGLEAGAKKGFEAILSSGGSVVADALSGMLTSLIGGGKSKDILSKVELSLAANSTITIVGETRFPGFGGISPLPISATSYNENNMALYNVALGVWTLLETPKVRIDGTLVTSYDNQGRYSGTTFTCTYELQSTRGLLCTNPTASINRLTVSNYQERLVYNNESQDSELSMYAPEQGAYSYIESKKYYHEGNKVYSKPMNTVSGVSGNLLLMRGKKAARFGVHISFELTDSRTGEIYFYSKYFDVDFIDGTVKNVTHGKPGVGGIIII